jgi:hypothetical protein
MSVTETSPNPRAEKSSSAASTMRWRTACRLRSTSEDGTAAGAEGSGVTVEHYLY